MRVGLLCSPTDTNTCEAIWAEACGRGHEKVWRKARKALEGDLGLGLIARRSRLRDRVRIDGFLLIGFRKTGGADLLALAVRPEEQRQGIGWELHAGFLDALRDHDLGPVECRVDERLLTMQMFLRTVGWRAIGIERNAGSDNQHDLLVFRYKGSNDQAAELAVPPPITADAPASKRLPRLVAYSPVQAFRPTGEE